jgi:hypothetical protein
LSKEVGIGRSPLQQIQPLLKLFHHFRHGRGLDKSCSSAWLVMT